MLASICLLDSEIVNILFFSVTYAFFPRFCNIFRVLVRNTAVALHYLHKLLDGGVVDFVYQKILVSLHVSSGFSGNVLYMSFCKLFD